MLQYELQLTYKRGQYLNIDILAYFWYFRFAARPLSIEYAGAFYHVISRGNERKAVFS